MQGPNTDENFEVSKINAKDTSWVSKKSTDLP